MKKLIMTLVLMPLAVLATTWYVNGSTGSDSNSGTGESSAKATIQAAIDVSSAGDTILVAPGTYGLFASHNKRISICGTGGVNLTEIDGQETYNTVDGILELAEEFDSDSRPAITNTIVEGFVIRQLSCIRGGTLKRCVIRDNDTWSRGGAAFNYGVAENCLFLNNRGMNGAAADGSLLRNCTMVGNSARDIDGVCMNSVLENCIVYGNANDARSTWQYWLDRNPLVTSIGYREKNVYVGDPGFVDAANGDYRLAAGSPCIDAGDNTYVTGDKDLAGNARIANGTVDIGCYEYGAAAIPAANGLYMVIDLSGGPSATLYPVSYLDSVPAGGWTDEYKTTKLVLRKIMPGKFMMGARTDYYEYSESETPQHEVTLTKPFYIGVFEITQRQWELVMGTRPSYFNNDAYYAKRPVEKVGWDQIRGKYSDSDWPHTSNVGGESFIGRIRRKTGLDKFDLPTEAQWEYACRAGTTTFFYDGVEINDSNIYDRLDALARNKHNQSGDSKFGVYGSSEVGLYEPNAWGLYDMIGNVWEQCLDWYGTYTGDSVVDPLGPESGVRRLFKGGSWDSEGFGGGKWCRCSSRLYWFDFSQYQVDDEMYYAYFDIGFRVRVILEEETMYTVTFDLNGADGAAPTKREIAEGAAIGALPTPEREGYEFLGWHVGKESSSEEVTASTVVTGDLIVYAVWQLAEYTVTFDLNGADGATPASRGVTHGSAIGTLPTPAWTGYMFLGWFTSPYDWEGWQVSAETTVTGDATYYARWERISYTVTFDANGGSGGGDYTYYYGDNLGSSPTPTWTGRTFLGWFTAKTGGTQVSSSTAVTANIIYYAQWRVNTYTVTFDLNGADGAAPARREIAYGTAIGALPTVTRTGHTFLGWFTAASGGTQVYATDAVTFARTLYAHWQANTYTVTFNANGGDSSCSYSRTYGSQVGTLPAASRAGYVFKGWFTAASGGTRVSASATVTGDATYYARWATHAEELAATLGTANAEFSTDANAPWFPEGSAVRSGFISHNGSSTMSVRLYGSGLLSFRWKVSSEPNYDALSYSVDGIQGGRVSGEQGWASASILVAGDGWHTVRFTYSKDGGSTYGNDCGWVDSLTWTGSAPPAANFTITFNANGGTVGTASVTRSQGTQLGTLPVPTRSGYSFLGWFTAASGGTQVYASTVVSANATYYARWQADGSGGGSGGGTTPPAPTVTYTVTFDGNGGSVDTPRVTRTAGAEIGSMPVPEAEGYEFLGWFTAKTGGTQVTASTKVTANATCYAQWRAVEDPNTLWDEDEAFDAEAAATFDGFLTKDGEVRGTIQVKAGKANAGTGVAKATASVVLLGQGKKLSYKGAFGRPGAAGDFTPGVATLTCNGQPNLELRLGRNALWGELGAYEIEGARNVFAKAGDPKAAALSRWQGAYTLVLETVDAEGAGSAFAWGYSGLTLTVGAKGKVKVQGTMVDGAKVSVTAQLLVGEKRCCIPVAVPLYSKKGGFGLNLWLQDDGEIEAGELGAWDATASKTPFRAWFGEDVPVARVGAALPAELSFLFMGEPEFADAEVLYDFVPWEVTIATGARWTLPAAGNVKFDRESEEYVDAKDSSNAAGLKLTYVSKTGMFKGSFKLYAVDGAGRLKKLTANVSGVMVGRQGYGTATVKNVGSWPVSIQ